MAQKFLPVKYEVIGGIDKNCIEIVRIAESNDSGLRQLILFPSFA